MRRLLVSTFSISIDGFGAGAGQGLARPLGKGGEQLHEWFDETGSGPDAVFTARGMSTAGAWIIGRNMFGPVRGPWADEAWRGWWGDTPPFHLPVYVLTHHPREPIEMDGGTTFHFVTDGIHRALELASAAAGELDVRVGGGCDTIRQFLVAGLIDEMHLAIVPTLLGTGESLLEGIDLVRLGYRCVEHVGTEKATHVVLSKQTRN
jgi:dihydrofolate reductase